jgi:hypothetical protein
MLSTRYCLAIVALVAVSAVIFMSCSESETNLSGGSGAADLMGSGPPRGELLTDDPLPNPSIDIEKSTNGEDADQPPGPTIPVGDPVIWEYVVTNTGDVELIDILVKDNMLGDVYSMDRLAPGETFAFQVSGTAAPGQYQNVASVYWWARQFPEFGDADTSHYFGSEPVKCLDIEKSTNGHDADTAPGPVILVGGVVTWEYVVTNTGDAEITEIVVADDMLGQICTIDRLAPGESATCQAVGTAVAGQYENVGTVSWLVQGDPVVGDADTSHYYGEEPATGDEGCSHGYWKNHEDDWVATGYSPDQSVESVFGAAAAYPEVGSATLMEALEFKGGGGEEGGARILLKQAVASLLNAAHPAVMFVASPAGVISTTDAALASGDRYTMTALGEDMDDDNNLGCPLSDDRPRTKERTRDGWE